MSEEEERPPLPRTVAQKKKPEMGSEGDLAIQTPPTPTPFSFSPGLLAARFWV